MKKKVLTIVFVAILANLFCQKIPDKIQYFVEALCLEYGMNAELCLSILLAENPYFNEKAEHKNPNDTVDLGLWQLNSRYIDHFSTYWKQDNFDVYDWKCNTYTAINHIKTLCEELETDEQVIKAYNCGIGAVKKNTIPLSTELYYLLVSKYMKELVK